MKKIKKQFLFLLCSLFVVGCADDIEIIPIDSTTSLSVEKARTWYETNLITNQGNTIFKAKTTDSTALSLKPLLNWDLAQLDNDSLWSVVELPWEYENGKQTIANSHVAEYCNTNNTDIAQVIRLVILKNRKTGDLYGFKMVVIPDLDYMLAHENELQANFYLHRDSLLSGMILFYSTSDKFINGWAYKNGMIVGKVNHGKSKSKSEAQRTSSTFEIYSIETCNYTKVEWKGMVGFNKDCSVSYFYSYGSWDTGSDFNGSFDSNTGTSGSTTESSTNQSGCPGTAYKDKCGYCVGGDTGKTPCIEEENKTSYPCAEINNLKIDAALIQRLKDLIIKAKNEPIEYGYLKTTKGTFLYPIKQTFKNVSYDTYFDKITERVHTHDNIPGGGTYVFSPEDLMALYSMYINGKMANPTTFRYIVVSAFGIGCLNITDVVAFEQFGKNYNLDELKKEYDITPKSGTDMNANLKQFMDILKSTKSGLTFSLGEFEMEDTNPDIEWNTKQLDNTGNVTNYNCN